MLQRWNKPNGYAEVLRISLPMALSMGATTIMEFTDRVFLGQYSVNAIAAALPSGIAVFLFMSFFLGAAGYVNVFVAQYSGSGSPERVGASLWQGIYFSLVSSLLLAGLYFAADPFFDLIGHPLEVRRLESIYFKILALGSGLAVMGMTLSCFYSGQGKTRVVMMVNIFGALINIPLDYALINGVWFFPELGIIGAGLATVAAWGTTTLIFLRLIFTRRNNRRFGIWSQRSFDRDLFVRLMKYGAPAGVQFFIDIFAITYFVFMIGRLGKTELVATNAAFTINVLAFLPVVGFSIGVSTMVGQAMGRKRPDDAAEAVTSALHLALFYMGLAALIFVLAPRFLLDLFRPRDFSPQDYAAIMETGVILLRFVAFYCLFDALALIYSGAIKGAGDTYFIMWGFGLLGLLLMVIPTFVVVELMHLGVIEAWICAAVYVSSLGLLFWARYRGGAWKTMSVIN